MNLKKFLYRLVIVLVFTPFSLQADEPLNFEEKKTFRKQARTFAFCQGTYTAWSDYLLKHNPAVSKTVKGLSTGAHAAALYSLMLLYTSNINNKKPKKYGVYSPYVNALADEAYNISMALFEIKDFTEANNLLTSCMNLQKLQAVIIELLREDMYELP